MSGFFLAAASVASPSRKPTVVMLLQPAFTISSMLSAYSASEEDSTSAVVTPRSAAALTRPSCEVWLKDLSSNPPESDTMQALKSELSTAGDDDAASVGALELGVSVAAVLSDARSPQPARARAAMVAIAAIDAVFFTAPPDLGTDELGGTAGRARTAGHSNRRPR